MKIWSNIWSPRSVVIVHIHFENGIIALEASLCHVHKKANPSEKFETIEAVIARYGKEKPYALHVTGTGVLTRKVEFLPGYKEQLIVNGNKEEFYFTSFEDGIHVITSFFRKNSIEHIVSKLLELKITLLHISSGMVPALIFAEENDTISFDNIVQFEHGRIASIERNPSFNGRTLMKGIYQSTSDVISESILLTFQQTFSNLTTALPDDEKAKAYDNYKQYSQFRFFGVGIVSFVLIALLINYFYLNALNNQVADLEVSLTLNNDNLSLLEKLKQEKTRKSLLVESAGLYQKEFISYFLDKIVETVPSQLSLQSLQVFPLKENLKEKRKVEFYNTQIELSGTTPTSEILDDWMERMNRFSWVSSVELLNYLKSEKGDATFKLVILLNP